MKRAEQKVRKAKTERPQPKYESKYESRKEDWIPNSADVLERLYSSMKKSSIICSVESMWNLLTWVSLKVEEDADTIRGYEKNRGKNWKYDNKNV